jgi:serine/threonine protein phosphatase PrpC
VAHLSSFDYPDARDEAVFRSARLGAFSLSACTVHGGEQPNEDSFAVTERDGCLAVAVFDGATSLRPIPALASRGVTGARYASHFLRDRFADAALDLPPREALLRLNNWLLQSLADLGGADLADTHTLPASTATVVRVLPGQIAAEVAHVGDSALVAYYRDGSSGVLTPNDNARFDRRMRDLMTDIARERGIPLRQARQAPEVRQALLDMYRYRNNRPDGDGCGVVNGDPHLARYVFTTRLALDDVAALLLVSDGLTPVDRSLERAEDRAWMREVIAAAGLKGLVQCKRAAEDADPDWRHARYKHSDDATGVYLDFKE